MKKKNMMKFAAISTAYQQTQALNPLIITSILPFAARIIIMTRKRADTVSFLESRETRINPRSILVEIPRCKYCDDPDHKEHEIDLFGYDDFFGHFPGISSDEYGGQTIKTSDKSSSLQMKK
jgi:hypothetical protein